MNFDFVDEYGLPLHNGDAGDSPHNLGRIFCLKYLINIDFYLDYSSDFWKGFHNINTKNGLIRHPIQWNDPKDFSSDAIEPIILALLCLKNNETKTFKYLSLIWKNILKNKFKYPNGDLFRPHHLAIWGRVFNYKTAIYLGDFFIFIFVLYREFLGRHLKTKEKTPSVSDDINLILMLRVFKKINPTSFILISLKIYNIEKCLIQYFYKKSDLGDYVLNLFLDEIELNK